MSELNEAYSAYMQAAREARIAFYGSDPFEGRTDPIHYAPYGKNAAGEFDCGATDGGYSGQPIRVTCLGCMKRSPGLWPKLA
jgi:hypothetical protein